MKHICLFLVLLLFISCNASILMTNGEISKPNNNSGSDSGNKTVFSGKAATGVNATKSYYKDYIAVRWNSVSGADYYTLEKSIQDSSDLPSNAVWTIIGESIKDTSYSDSLNLEVGKYYNYRVTAHTYSGETGDVSKSSVGTILSSPDSLDATKGTNETNIVISWNQMPYVESYEVYKSTIESINGNRSELVDTVNVNENSAVRYYSYAVDDKEKGTELYFAIIGVGPTGEKADISFSRSGYTLVPGAPSKPEVIVSKGNSSQYIDVRFKSIADDSEYKYVIKRSYPGSAEQIIYSTESDGALPSRDSEGYYVYTDTNVRPNVEYTYSITASNDIGISQAGIASGYLLSTVRNLALVPNTDPDNLGYDISFMLPVGASDTDRAIEYTYHVIKTFKNGQTEEIEYSEAEFSNLDTFIPVDKNPTKDSELEEVKSIEIYVTAGDESSERAISNTIAMLPDPVTSIAATSFSKPISGDYANSSGVYPVHVSWTTDSTQTQTLTRESSDGTIRTFQVSGGAFTDETTSPLVIYDYYIDTSDELGRTLGEIKHAADSYGAVTPDVYIDIFESVSLKPWDRQGYVPDEYKTYWKKSKIATLVGYGNASDLGTQMKALDDAEDSDHYRSGKVTYSAAMEGVGGQIYFTYSKFGENANYYMTGNYEMHVNASGTGSASSNTNGFEISGMYPGKVVLDKISVKSKNFAGTYVFTINYKDGSESYEVAVK